MMLSSPRPIASCGLNGDSSSRPKRRRASALGIFLRRHNSNTSFEPCKASSAFLDNVENLPVDDTLTASVSSIASTNSLREAGSSPCCTIDATSIKSCLKYRTQIASLQHVFAHSKKEDHESNPENTPSVHFGSIEIHSHGIVLGDNPAVSNGPPVTIEWASFDTVLESVDRWEASRAAEPRQGQELLLPQRLREDLIRRSGSSSRQEVAQALRAAGRIRGRRQRTAHRSLVNARWRQRWARATTKSTGGLMD